MPEATRLPPILKPGFPGVLRVSGTPVAGVHEVVTQHRTFFCSEGGYVFTGNLFGPDGSLIGGEVKPGGKIDISPAMKIGSGATEIIEFASLDCPYSKLLNKELSKLTGITRYVFLKHSPGDALSEAVTAEVLDNPDMLGRGYAPFRGEQGGYLADASTRKKMRTHLEVFNLLGVRATPVVVVEGRVFTGVDDIISFLSGKGGEA